MAGAAPIARDRTAQAAERQLAAAKRILKSRKSKDSLIEFTEFTMPSVDDPEDADKSRYDAQYFHKALAAALEEVDAGRILRLIITFPPRHGKLCADSTEVLTLDGWKRHGDLRPGDSVFGPDGKPTKVIAVSAPDLASLEVEFTDGSAVKVHPGHEWTVWQRGGFRTDWFTLETRDLMSRKLMTGGAKPRATYQLPLRPCVEFGEIKLRMHPYALGAWLGDGTASSPNMTHDARETEVVEAITACGYAPRRAWVHRSTGVVTTSFCGDVRGVAGPMWADLKAIDVANNKHIPDDYKFSSVAQRLDLLAGLIDTDGHVERSTGRVRIATVSERLADDITDVARSLGWHVCKYRQEAALSTSGIQGTKPTFYIGFQPDRDIPTRLPRKKITRFAPRRRVGIKAVRPCKPEIGRCIQVDREDGLYCVGREMIVTHNSELTSRRFPAWLLGRDPYRHIMFGTYNQPFAEDYGRDVRGIMDGDQFKQVFPGTTLAKGQKSADRLATNEGGRCVFVGRGGSATGRGADFLIIDDPLKDRAEANSATIREELWNWFNDTMSTRLMSDTGAIIIIMTRWHEDDLVGRLTDPTNPHFNAEEAAQWKIINIPAIAEEGDILGRKAGEALWPSRFGIEYLEGFRRRNPVGFSALYQQRPTPADGEFFKAGMLPGYKQEDLPKNLRVYAASDHAVGIKQTNDRNCLLVVGVDEFSNIWLLDCWWKRAKADETVEAMIHLMKRWKPLVWWAEGGHISKSIGPFLFKRMREESVFVNIREQTPAADKVTRAQSIAGRCAMGMVRFPNSAAWAEDAKQELLKFPQGRHDDFVDTLAHLGLGLDKLIRAPIQTERTTGPAVGTFGWVKQASEERRQQDKLRINLAGM